MRKLRRKMETVLASSVLALIAGMPAFAAAPVPAFASASAVLQKSNENLYKQNSLTFSGNMNIDLSMSPESGGAAAQGYLTLAYALSETTAPQKSFKLDVSLKSNAGSTNLSKNPTKMEDKVSMYVVPNDAGNYDAYIGVASLDTEPADGSADMNGEDKSSSISDETLAWEHFILQKNEYKDEAAYKYKLGVDKSIMPNFTAAQEAEEETEGEAEKEDNDILEGSFSWDELYNIIGASGNTEKFGDAATDVKDAGIMMIDYIAPYFNGCTFNTRYFVDKKTGLPAKVSGTITNGKWDRLSELLSAKANLGNDGAIDASYINAVIKNVSFNADYSYEKPDISVPSYAKDSAEEVSP